jgi:two-component system sensor histidine kinase YesM
MTRQISDLMDRRLEDEKNKRDLEYRMLQSPINPHFLYNTLNSIKWMAIIQNATGIVEMTTALSRFLKVLSKETRELVTLRDELLLMDDYLVIQKYRYGGSVNFEKKIEDWLLDTPIPRFILQPLVENAIFHGIEPKGSGNIVLLAERRDADVLISLTDDGVGMVAPQLPADGESVRGLGIRSVDERLRYAFGEGYGLSIESKQGSYTKVTIRVPGNGEGGR